MPLHSFKRPTLNATAYNVGWYTLDWFNAVAVPSRSFNRHTLNAIASKNTQPMTEQEFKRKYDDVEKLPTHIFSSRDLTKPVGKEFREYLLFLLLNNKDCLRYIHRKSLEFVNYGGSNNLSFEKWCSQLKTQLNTKEIKDE